MPHGNKPWIMTYTGRRVNPLDVLPSDIDISDIAQSLALTNRFGGHTAFPISVAQHSVAVSLLVPAEHAMQALLHDASEAYLGDVTKWLKETSVYDVYRAAEEQAQRSVYVTFGCESETHQLVKDADWEMVVFECGVGYGDKNWLGNSTIEDPAWAPWPWPRARREFLDRFIVLGGRL